MLRIKDVYLLLTYFTLRTGLAALRVALRTDAYYVILAETNSETNS